MSQSDIDPNASSGSGSSGGTGGGSGNRQGMNGSAVGSPEEEAAPDEIAVTVSLLSGSRKNVLQFKINVRPQGGLDQIVAALQQRPHIKNDDRFNKWIYVEFGDHQFKNEPSSDDRHNFQQFLFSDEGDKAVSIISAAVNIRPVYIDESAQDAEDDQAVFPELAPEWHEDTVELAHLADKFRSFFVGQVTGSAPHLDALQLKDPDGLILYDDNALRNCIRNHIDKDPLDMEIIVAWKSESSMSQLAGDVRRALANLSRMFKNQDIGKNADTLKDINIDNVAVNYTKDQLRGCSAGNAVEIIPGNQELNKIVLALALKRKLRNDKNQDKTDEELVQRLDITSNNLEFINEKLTPIKEEARRCIEELGHICTLKKTHEELKETMRKLEQRRQFTLSDGADITSSEFVALLYRSIQRSESNVFEGDVDKISGPELSWEELIQKKNIQKGVVISRDTFSTQTFQETPNDMMQLSSPAEKYLNGDCTAPELTGQSKIYLKQQHNDKQVTIENVLAAKSGLKRQAGAEARNFWALDGLQALSNGFSNDWDFENRITASYVQHNYARAKRAVKKTFFIDKDKTELHPDLVRSD